MKIGCFSDENGAVLQVSEAAEQAMFAGLADGFGAGGALRVRRNGCHCWWNGCDSREIACFSAENRHDFGSMARRVFVSW